MNKQQLWEAVSDALKDKPSEQPVKNAGHIDSDPANGNKANAKSGMANKKFRQKGNPNQQYSVDVISRAVAKLA